MTAASTLERVNARGAVNLWSAAILSFLAVGCVAVGAPGPAALIVVGVAADLGVVWALRRTAQ